MGFKLKEWKNAGLQNVHFFIHQNLEVESPLLAAYFIKKINAEFGLKLTIPNQKDESNNNGQISLL